MTEETETTVIKEVLPESKVRVFIIEHSFRVGKRILIAAAATVMIAASLATVKVSTTQADDSQIVNKEFLIESREQPVWMITVLGAWLLGVATEINLDLAVLLKILTRPGDND